MDYFKVVRKTVKRGIYRSALINAPTFKLEYSLNETTAAPEKTLGIFVFCDLMFVSQITDHISDPVVFRGTGREIVRNNILISHYQDEDHLFAFYNDRKPDTMEPHRGTALLKTFVPIEIIHPSVYWK